MTLLNNWLASLPFMTTERADYVISSFWPMMEGAILYTIPLAVISFFCGLFIAVIVAVICTLPHPNLMTKILQGICRTYISIIRGRQCWCRSSLSSTVYLKLASNLSLSQPQLLRSPLTLVLMQQKR